MTTLVWLFLGMSVLITSFLTWKITLWNSKRKIKGIFKQISKVKHQDRNTQNWFENQIISIKIKNNIK